eukprot:12016761-Karenia_brevis.AAC.1
MPKDYISYHRKVNKRRVVTLAVLKIRRQQGGGSAWIISARFVGRRRHRHPRVLSRIWKQR